MKKSKISPAFIVVCIVILVAAYGIGFCISEINKSRIKAAQNKILSQKIKNTESSDITDDTQERTYTSAPNRERETIPQTESINTRNNQFSVNRSMRTNTRRGMQNSGGQDFTAMMDQRTQAAETFQNMMNEEWVQMMANFDNLGYDQGFDTFDEALAVEMQDFGGQDMFNNYDVFDSQNMSDNQETIDELDNYDLQGGY